MGDAAGLITVVDANTRALVPEGGCDRVHPHLVRHASGPIYGSKLADISSGALIAGNSGTVLVDT